MLLSIPEGASEERTDTLNKLAAEYKALSSSNRLNSLKDKHLAEELQDIQRKYNEASADYGRTKDEHDALNNKYIKLKQLSQQLSERTKQADLKAAAALNAEQQRRVKLTESFSGGIAKISSKLDSLTARREAVVTENFNLKAVLKSYLEEFDADQRSQQVEATDGAAQDVGPENNQKDEQVNSEKTNNSNETQKVSDEIVDCEGSTSTSEIVDSTDKAVAAEETTAETVDPAVTAAAEQAAQTERDAEAANAEAMAAAEDVTRLAQLRATEHELRLKSAKYSELFDTFQSKLSGCNTGFQAKQSSIEALSKEMVALEKENAVIGKRVADCVMSTKVQYHATWVSAIYFTFSLIIYSKYMSNIEGIH